MEAIMAKSFVRSVPEGDSGETEVLDFFGERLQFRQRHVFKRTLVAADGDAPNDLKRNRKFGGGHYPNCDQDFLG
jgi:hypothetical protein